MEKRRSPRTDRQVEFFCYLDGVRFDSKSLNISASGAFLRTDDPIREGARVVMSPKGADLQRLPALLIGTVVRIQTAPEKGVGIQWTRCLSRGGVDGIRCLAEYFPEIFGKPLQEPPDEVAAAPVVGYILAAGSYYVPDSTGFGGAGTQAPRQGPIPSARPAPASPALRPGSGQAPGSAAGQTGAEAARTARTLETNGAEDGGVGRRGGEPGGPACSAATPPVAPETEPAHAPAAPTARTRGQTGTYSFGMGKASAEPVFPTASSLGQGSGQDGASTQPSAPGGTTKKGVPLGQFLATRLSEAESSTLTSPKPFNKSQEAGPVTRFVSQVEALFPVELPVALAIGHKRVSGALRRLGLKCMLISCNGAEAKDIKQDDKVAVRMAIPLHRQEFKMEFACAFSGFRRDDDSGAQCLYLKIINVNQGAQPGLFERYVKFLYYRQLSS